jgi:hypothetical protein
VHFFWLEWEELQCCKTATPTKNRRGFIVPRLIVHDYPQSVRKYPQRRAFSATGVAGVRSLRMGEVFMPLKSLKWTVCLGVALAPWLLAVPAPAADEVFSVTSIISLPANSPGPNQPKLPNNPLASFDIQFVDPVAGVFLLADRSNQSIDVASTSTNLIISQLQPGSLKGSVLVGGFAGVVSSAPGSACNPNPANRQSPVAPNCSGPNGVLAIHQYGQGDPQGNGKGKGQAKTEVWVGDGSSQVWALNLTTGSPVVPPISTALSGAGTDPTRATSCATIRMIASL